jgi:hypothetical protein
MIWGDGLATLVPQQFGRFSRAMQYLCLMFRCRLANMRVVTDVRTSRLRPYSANSMVRLRFVGYVQMRTRY